MTGKKIFKEIYIGHTLQARDYKGFSYGRQPSTGIIERYVCDKCTNNPGIKDIANCVTTKDYGIVKRKESENAVVEIRQLGNMVSTGNFRNPQAGRVYDSNGLMPTLNTCSSGGHEPKIVEQILEPNTQGTSNALTTVQKDNLLLTKEQPIGSIATNTSERFSMYSPGGISKCLKANKHDIGVLLQGIEELKGAVYHNGYWYRIRKLTPKECGRLMGVSDDCIDKMAEVNSNTQLYKQFGNSIVVDCMVAMFSKLHIQGLPTWEELINGD